MSQKFIEVNRGVLGKGAKEYEYVLEVSTDILEKKVGNARLRLIEEKPSIRKIRTRYDPEISIEGDKDASMELYLGYNPKELKSALKKLIMIVTMPFISFFFVGLYSLAANSQKIMPEWIKWFTIPLLAAGLVWWTYKLFKEYYKLVMNCLANYFKSRELKKLLDKEGCTNDRSN